MVRVPGQRRRFRARGLEVPQRSHHPQVPDGYGAVLGRRGEPVAVAVPTDLMHRLGVVSQRANSVAHTLSRVPEFDRRVLRPGGHQRGSGVPVDVMYVGVVTLESVCVFVQPEVPNLHYSVVSASGERSVCRRALHRWDGEDWGVLSRPPKDGRTLTHPDRHWAQPHLRELRHATLCPKADPTTTPTAPTPSTTLSLSKGAQRRGLHTCRTRPGTDRNRLMAQSRGNHGELTSWGE